MRNILSEELIKKNDLVVLNLQGDLLYRCQDGFPAYSKEFAEDGYEKCVKDYPNEKYGWFLAERNGIYWTSNGCNKNWGIKAGWEIIKESVKD